MVKLIEKFTYGFEDVSLEPSANSPIYSRKDVNTTSVIGGIKFTTPIISSPMADVTDSVMAIAMAKAGGIGCIHRFYDDFEQQLKEVSLVREAGFPVWAAVGTTEKCYDKASQLILAGATGIIVDVAFLNHRTLSHCEKIKKGFPDVFLVSGNVATGAGFRMGIEAGLDAIRVGIGNGNACRTSRVTGVGIGLVTSLMECLEEKRNAMLNGRQVYIICDGGMDVGGSFCKAIAAGADLTIMGRAFAGTKEGPGESTDANGIPDYESRVNARYKVYRGSASMEAQILYKKGEAITSEGVKSIVKVSGSVEETMRKYNGALRSSMSYLGAKNLDEYRSNAIFRLVSQGVFSQQKARGLQSMEITI